ncbi:MAG: hypothetical protein RL441_1024 [Actinomycetota bacterium]|jgi:RNA polymerase sigma factor (sigma-70 family)
MKASDDEIELFLEQHWTSLTRFVNSLSGGSAHAEDLLQNALLSCYPKWHTIAPGRHEAYLKVAIVREHIARWRTRRWREVLVNEYEIEPALDDAQDRLALNDLMLRSLRRLPVRQSTALILRFAYDWPINDVAAAMHVPAGTVKSLCARGLATLRLDPGLTNFSNVAHSPNSEVHNHA